MKKLILFILTMVLFMPVVHAHEVDLSNYITIPETITASTKIEVSEDFGEYELYYQWIAMDKVSYEAYKGYLEQQESLKNELDELGEDATEDDIRGFYNSIAELEKNKNGTKPKYDNEKWAKSNNGTVPFNLSMEGIKERDPYVLWIKAVSTEDESEIYNERLIHYAISEDDIESADTSDNVLVLAVLAVAATGLMVVSYKKSRA